MLNFLIKYSAVVLELNRLLGTRFVPDHPSNKTPLGESVYGILAHHNAGNYSHRDYELQKTAFLIQNLKELEENRPDLLSAYKNVLRKTGSSDSFFGARFEISSASSLVMKGVLVEKDESPDIRIKESLVEIECTSVRLRTDKVIKEDLTYKVQAAIYKKSQKGYGTFSTALFIDITNVAYFTQQFNPDEFRRAVVNYEGENPFGAVLLFISMMNSDLDRFETNYLRIDHAKISDDLFSFLNIHNPPGAHRVTDFSIPYEG